MHQIKTTLGKALRYVVRPEATLGGLLVSTTAAVIDPSDWRATAESFEASRELRQGAGRKSSVLAHHVIQAFAPGEITSGAQAHDIGVVFAERITQGRFAYTLATHVDKGHLHNHLIINAVSHIDGKALRVQKQTLAEFRAVSDELCRGMRLSVIERDGNLLRPALKEVYARARGASRHEQVRLAIDHAVSSSNNWLDYELTLESQGVEVGRSQRRAVTYRTGSMARAVRDIRLGPAYEEGAVMARLGGTSVLRFDAHESLVVPPRASALARHRGDGGSSAEPSAGMHAVTLKVPGTAGQRCISVHPDQVVRHGKVMRSYLPEHSTQAVLNRGGGIVANVPTKALYVAFAPPARELVRRHNQIESSRGLRGGKRMREQVERLATSANLLNVRGRFGILTGSDALAHVSALGAEIERAETRIQSLAVALDETAPGSRDRADLRVQLADASRSMQDLQTTAAELIEWVQATPSRAIGHPEHAHTDFADLALRQRLGDVEPADLSALGVPAARVSYLLSPPAPGEVPEGPAGGAAGRAELSERAQEVPAQPPRGHSKADGERPMETSQGREGRPARPLEGAVVVSGEMTECLAAPARPGDVVEDLGYAAGAGSLDVTEERRQRGGPSHRAPGRDVSQRPAGWKTMSLSDRAAWLSGRSVREGAGDADDNTPRRRR